MISSIDPFQYHSKRYHLKEHGAMNAMEPPPLEEIHVGPPPIEEIQIMETINTLESPSMKEVVIDENFILTHQVTSLLSVALKA